MAIDGVLLAPAFLEAGRLTAADIHWARVGRGLVPVGETEFARDPVFGYHRVGPAGFRRAKERRGGGARAGRQYQPGGYQARRARPGSASCWPPCGTGPGSSSTPPNTPTWRRWPTGCCLPSGRVSRSCSAPGRRSCGPWPAWSRRRRFAVTQIWHSRRRGGHGLIVAGSHIGRTNRQVAVLRARGGSIGIELDVPAIMSGSPDVAAATARRVTAALARADVLLYTSRTVVAGPRRRGQSRHRPPGVRLPWRPRSARRWPPGPPGSSPRAGSPRMTSRSRGLGIRRAEVVGQLFPGLISVFRPHRRGAGGGRRALRRLRRERRRRRDAGAGRGDPQR